LLSKQQYNTVYITHSDIREYITNKTTTRTTLYEKINKFARKISKNFAIDIYQNV